VACNAPFSPASTGISEQGFPPLEAAETIDLAMRRLRPERMLLGRWEYEYEVRLGDELIVVDRDPEHSACRALLAKGIKGKARFMRDGKPSLIMDIEKAAQYRVQDKGRHGPRFVKYRQANQFSQTYSMDSSSWNYARTVEPQASWKETMLFRILGTMSLVAAAPSEKMKLFLPAPNAIEPLATVTYSRLKQELRIFLALTKRNTRSCSSG